MQDESLGRGVGRHRWDGLKTRVRGNVDDAAAAAIPHLYAKQVVNVQALVALTHLLGVEMRNRRSGGIINIASNASFQPVPAMATYAATKAFVLHFSEALSYELAGDGVRVMAACPGPTATNFFAGTPIKMSVKNMDSSESVV